MADKKLYRRPYTFDRTVRMLISVFLILLGIYFLYILRSVLLPFLIAWLVAYMLNPIVRFYQKKLHVSHGVAVILTLISAAGVLFLLGFLLTPLISKELWQINSLIANFHLADIENSRYSGTINKLIGRYIDFEFLNKALHEGSISDIIDYASPAIKSIFSSTINLLIGLTVVFITLLYMIFILLDYDKINELWRYLIPPKYRPVVNRITLDVERNMNNYFRHQAMICTILAVLYALGFQLIGLPLAIVFGIIVGLLHMIPYLQVISFPPAILLCWLRSYQTGDGFWVMIGLTILVYVIVQCIMDLFLVPKIMGKAMGLNPAIILLSLSIWGYLLGVVGMIIAIPLTTLLLSYYKEFISSAEIIAAEKEDRRKNKESEIT